MSVTSFNETIVRPQPIQQASRISAAWTERIEAVGRHSLRYGLVFVLLWIGGMKFTAYEAEGISAFVANSPLMSWACSLFSVQGFSALLGASEIGIALLIASRPFSARTALVGNAGAVGIFLTTLSFLLTTPRRLGGIGGRLPRTVGRPRPVPRQGLCSARRLSLDVQPRLACRGVPGWPRLTMTKQATRQGATAPCRSTKHALLPPH